MAGFISRLWKRSFVEDLKGTYTNTSSLLMTVHAGSHGPVTEGSSPHPLAIQFERGLSVSPVKEKLLNYFRAKEKKSMGFPAVRSGGIGFCFPWPHMREPVSSPNQVIWKVLLGPISR